MWRCLLSTRDIVTHSDTKCNNHQARLFKIWLELQMHNSKAWAISRHLTRFMSNRRCNLVIRAFFTLFRNLSVRPKTVYFPYWLECEMLDIIVTLLSLFHLTKERIVMTTIILSDQHWTQPQLILPHVFLDHSCGLPSPFSRSQYACFIFHQRRNPPRLIQIFEWQNSWSRPEVRCYTYLCFFNLETMSGAGM